MSGWLGRVRQLANRLKSGWDYANIAWVVLVALGLAPVILGFLAGATPDVIAIYGIATIAYAVVIVSEGLPLLRRLLARKTEKLKFDFRGCCGTMWGLGDNRSEYHLCVGVCNPSSTTVENANIYITIPTVPSINGRALQWVGMRLGEPLTINPTPPGFHHHAELVSRVEGSRSFEFRLAYATWPLMVGNYEVVLSATGKDTEPTTVRAVVVPADDPPIDIRPLDTSGWVEINTK